MELTWRRPSTPFPPDTRAPGELVSSPVAATERPWVLLLGGDDACGLKWIASRARDLPIISPPSEPPLAIAVHELPPPGISGERVLFAPRLDRTFYDNLAAGSFSAASPLYLLPRLAQLASEGAPLTFVATAREGGFAERGLASRFEIRRVSGGSLQEESEEAAELPIWQRELARGLASRDPESRARACESAVAQAPGKALVHLFLASSLLERRERGDAVAALKRAIELEPTLAAAHYELGKALLQMDDLPGAIASFRKTLELLPEYPSAWGNLGAALGEVQDLEASSEALREAVRLDPRNAAFHSSLGVSYRDRGLPEEAEGEFRRALELDPGFVFGHYNLAHVLYLEGRYPEAIELFEKAQSMDRTRSPRQALLLACTRLASGDTEGAKRDYREIFGRLPEAAKKDMRTVAEWDLKQLAERTGVRAELKEAAGLLRALT